MYRRQRVNWRNKWIKEIISTNDRILMCVCGASGSGKTCLIYSRLTQPIEDIYQPAFKQVVYVYRFWQTLYSNFKGDVKPSVTFVCVERKNNVEASDSFIVDQSFQVFAYKKTLVLYKNSCEEILQCKASSTLATAGRQNNLSVIFIIQNL